MDQDCGGVRGIVRTTSQIDQILQPRNRFLQSHGAGRVRIRSYESAIPGAGADRDIRGGVAADVLSDVQRGLSTDRAVDAAVRSWNCALHHGDVLAGVFANNPFECVLGLLPRTGHQRLVIFPRQQIENKFDNRGIAAAQHGFRIARAILKLKPHQNRTSGLREGLHHRAEISRRQRQSSDHRAAKLHEFAPRNPARLKRRR